MTAREAATLGPWLWAAFPIGCILLGVLIRRWHDSWRDARHTLNQAYATIPSRDEKPPAPGAAHGPRPAPGPTPDETATLAALYRARTHATPAACQAAQIIADGLRLRFPGLDDLTLGLIVLDLFGYTRALGLGLPDPVYALHAVMDGFGLAAEELTRLTRTDVPR